MLTGGFWSDPSQIGVPDPKPVWSRCGCSTVEVSRGGLVNVGPSIEPEICLESECPMQDDNELAFFFFCTLSKPQ
jgi:hypothetical protein